MPSSAGSGVRSKADSKTSHSSKVLSSPFAWSQALSSTTGDLFFDLALQSWASAEAKTCERLGLARFLPGGHATLASCYPLHPMTLLSLPEMCARFGQHGRTLFSFLTSREPYSAAEFLENETLADPLPTVGLDRLYDFFVTTSPNSGSRHAARLSEIDTRIRETTGLTDEQHKILKVVGILNLLSQGGPAPRFCSCNPVRVVGLFADIRRGDSPGDRRS